MSIFKRHPLVNCGNCEFARARHVDEAAEARAEAAGHPFPPVLCLRFPQPVAKGREECCGDHSELMARRDMDLADMIAIAMVKQQRVPSAPVEDF